MSSTQPLTNRTEAIHRELKSLRWRFRFGSWMTLIVGCLLLCLVAFYFWYGYSEIKQLKDPEFVVSLVGQMADDQIPILRQRVEDEVNNNASTWAEQASKKVMETLPQVREQIESLALAQADKVIDEINVVGEKQFRQILDENREIMERAITDLKNGEDVSEEILLALQLSIEKELQIDPDSQADAVLTIASDLNKNMADLMVGENLNREQRAERRVLMLLKRLQVETFGEDAKLDVELPPVVQDIITEREENRMRKEPAPEPEKKEAPVEHPPAAQPNEAAQPAAEPAVEPAEMEEAPAEEKPAEPAAE